MVAVIGHPPRRVGGPGSAGHRRPGCAAANPVAWSRPEEAPHRASASSASCTAGADADASAAASPISRSV